MTMRPSRTIYASAVAALTASTVLLVSAAGTATATAKAKAKATVPAQAWYRVSAGSGINISYQPSVARFGSKLLVVWTQGSDVKARVLGSNAKTVGGISAVVSGWYSMTPDPHALTLHGVPTVVFAGTHDNVTPDPLNGPVVYAQSPTGATWATAGGSLTHDVDTSNGYGLSAVDDGTGQPIVTAAGSSTNHLTTHHGVDSAVPAAILDTEVRGADAAHQLGQTLDVSSARDLVSGITYAAYYSGLNDATMGIHGIQVDPNGAVAQPSAAAPFSVVTYSGQPISSDPGENIALAARVGGGVWAAYGSGYPDPHRLVLWNLQTGKKLVLNRPSAEIQYVSLSAAPGGRLWVSWIEGSRVLATRTNPSVTKFGVIRSVASPAIDGTAPSRTASDGALGPLDQLVNVIGKGDKDAAGNLISQVYSAHIFEGLRVSVTPAAVSYANGGTVTASVTDAGVPVPGVFVKVGGVVKKTNANGKASFAVAKHAAMGTHAVTAYGVGWWPGATSFKVH
jgi:hypothetical protein